MKTAKQKAAYTITITIPIEHQSRAKKAAYSNGFIAGRVNEAPENPYDNAKTVSNTFTKNLRHSWLCGWADGWRVYQREGLPPLNDCGDWLK